MIGRFLIIFALYLCYRGIKHLVFSNTIQNRSKNVGEICDSMVECKECGLYTPENEAIKKNIDGKLIYFCSEKCKRKFSN